MTDFLQSHWLDITTTLLGLAYIILEYRASIWMWLAGFLMQALRIHVGESVQEVQLQRWVNIRGSA